MLTNSFLASLSANGGAPNPLLFNDTFTGAAGPLSAHTTDSGDSWVTPDDAYWGDISLLELDGTGALINGGGAQINGVDIPATCRIEFAILTPSYTDYLDVAVNQTFSEVEPTGRYVTVSFAEDVDPDYVVRSVAISSNDGSLQASPVDTVILKTELAPYALSIVVGASSITVSIDSVEIASLSGFSLSDCVAGKTVIFPDTGIRIDQLQIFSE